MKVEEEISETKMRWRSKPNDDNDFNNGGMIEWESILVFYVNIWVMVVITGVHRAKSCAQKCPDFIGL